MSHFTLLVISKGRDDVERLLDPFNEQPDDDSPLLDSLLEEVDIVRAREVMAELRDYTGSEAWKIRSKESAPPAGADDLTVGRWYHGDDVFEQDGRIVYVYKRNGDAYGPDHGLVKGAKWDWWTIGGRWPGALPLKPGTGADTAAVPEDRKHWTGAEPVFPDGVDQGPKGALDIDRMHREAAEKAEREWASYEQIVATVGPLPDETWTNFEDKASPEFETARKEFWSNPTVVALQKADLLGFSDMPGEKFGQGMSREQYIQDAQDGALRAFALLNHDGQWYERGAMGWFGASTASPESSRRYYRKLAEIIDATPDDYFLTMVDCHI